jgi:uncharacterized membrane protein
MVLRIWAALCVAALLVPLALGGIPGVPGEVSNLRAPWLFIAALTLVCLAFPAFRARVAGLWRAPWEVLTERSERRLVAWLLAGYLLLYLKAALLDYYSFSIHAIDFSIFDHLFPNTAQGRFMWSAACGPCNQLGVHASPILFALYPLHRLADDPLFLVLLHPVVLWSAAFPLYALLREPRVAPAHRIFALLAYLNLPAVAGVLHYGFHVEVLYVPTGMWMLWALRRRRHAQAALAALLFLAVKEDGALYLGAFGLGLLVTRAAPPAFSLALVALAAAVFTLDTQWVIPENRGGTGYVLTASAAKYGRTLSEVAAGIVARPGEALADLFTGGWIPLALSFLLTPFASLPVLLASVPFVAVHSLSASGQMRALDLYYPAAWLPFLFYGLAEFLGRAVWPLWRRPIGKRERTLVAGAVFLVTSLAGGGYLRLRPPHPEYAAFAELRRALRLGGGLCVQGILVPHLGYEHLAGLRLLDRSCIDARPRYVVAAPGLTPYPQAPDDYAQTLHKLRTSGGYEERAFKGFHLFERVDARPRGKQASYGVVYGLLRARDGSIVAPAVAHALFWAVVGAV